MLTGGASEHVTVFPATTAVFCNTTVAFEDIEFADNASLDLSNGFCTMVVDDVVAGAGSSISLGSSTFDIRGSCSGASFCP